MKSKYNYSLDTSTLYYYILLQDYYADSNEDMNAYIICLWDVSS